jgi:hypothetical protein
MDIKAAQLVEEEGPDKEGQQSGAEQRRPGQADPEDEADSKEKFEPGQDKGNQIDQGGRDKLVLVDRQGKGLRLENLVVAGVEKNAAERKPNQERQKGVPAGPAASLGG